MSKPPRSRTATIRKFRIVQTEGARQMEREVKHYNLHAETEFEKCRVIQDRLFVSDFDRCLELPDLEKGEPS